MDISRILELHPASQPGLFGKFQALRGPVSKGEDEEGGGGGRACFVNGTVLND